MDRATFARADAAKLTSSALAGILALNGTLYELFDDPRKACLVGPAGPPRRAAATSVLFPRIRTGATP